MKSGSNLERVLAAGHFAVTAELGPPMSADANEVRHKMKLLRGAADAYNITDCQTAVVRLSSIASAIMLVQDGMEPVMQMTTRDRNRIAIQADILGAAAFGIKNCLCIAGDHQSFSAAGRLKGHPGAKNVYDVDSIQLVAILKKMRDEALQEGGDPLTVPPKLFIGAAWTPMGDPMDFRVLRLAKKVAAGADFIQTQGVYDVELFAKQMKEARNLGLHEKTAILAGIIVPKNAGMLRYMNSSVAGVKVPESLIARFPKPPKKDASKEEKKAAAAEAERIGKQIAVELIQQCREIEGVRGVHLQAIEWESAVPEIVKAAGLLPRPVVPAEPAQA
ncbi:MAG TPA: methylenetetrahydrofolate reductase [Planctomycetota bacterium]|nr:methylenetetrahydrofolate reductase [Planctomycetota bacterium]HRR81251.1 methylenetetrahydrofolate reductase [Planctomycetota bacterium]HRT94668.1 methylenetetrahydrofolate reductase [Planctomycetota bacterium]